MPATPPPPRVCVVGAAPVLWAPAARPRAAARGNSRSARNLFADSKKRLSDRVQVNVNNVGSIVRQAQRGSKSSEMLTQSAKNLAHTEATMDNTFNNLQRMQVLTAQLSLQQDQIKTKLEGTDEVKRQIQDMQR